MSYSPKKAAQTIAFFTMKNGGKAMHVLKAVKLVYLGDRKAIELYGYPIQEEQRVSMPYGPVNSTTLNYINGAVEPKYDNGWSCFVSDREDHHIGLADPCLSLNDLDELSDADIDVLDQVWNEFGDKDQWELVNWTHDPKNVPEWTDPNGSSINISLSNIMEAVSVQNSAETASELKSVSGSSDYLRGL